ncbi:hypothetical protein ACFXAZ_08935 [Streptomyces sp. NPDC059477]|uniref:hypothetical protein n=1 Tax=Streptomyces sp. NPDC059477 TaxID=3346847 RepID=UPI0036BA735B
MTRPHRWLRVSSYSAQATDVRMGGALANAPLITVLARQLTGYPGTVLVVANPVDLMTRLFAEESGSIRVFGIGSALDTARYRFTLARLPHIPLDAVRGHVIGEQGDAAVICACTTVNGHPPGTDRPPQYSPRSGRPSAPRTDAPNCPRPTPTPSSESRCASPRGSPCRACPPRRRPRPLGALLFPRIEAGANPATEGFLRSLDDGDFMSGRTEDRCPDVFAPAQVDGGGAERARQEGARRRGALPHHSVVLGYDMAANGDLLAEVVGLPAGAGTREQAAGPPSRLSQVGHGTGPATGGNRSRA